MELVILLALVFLNGFFSFSEIALVSSKKAKLEALAASRRGARTALKLRENSENFLSAIQVGITLIGIVTGVYGGMNVADDVAPLVSVVPRLAPYAHEIALALTVVAITYVSIVLGELVPKTIALSDPEGMAALVAPAIHGFSVVFFPVVRVLSGSTNLISAALRIKKQGEQVTEEELRQLLKTASSEGVIEKEQKYIHENLFYFSDKRAKHLMTHRTEIDWVDITRPFDEVLAEIKRSRHGKVICCEGGLDGIVGYVKVRDVLAACDSGEPVDLKAMIVKPPIVTENAEAQRVLDLFKREHVYFCFVIDEYGGFEGIITLYDIVENILGEIPEEGEDYEPDVFVREDMSVLVSGDAPVERLTEIIEGFSVDFETIDYSTVAGFVVSNMSKVPEVGDRIEVLGHVIEVVDTDAHRIDKILVYRSDSGGEEGEPPE
ncbi:MAG TPA: hemolysin family protein [Treponemataceae bacterium]|nr:hemolysin family protein [Treponemataceae bacterium]